MIFLKDTGQEKSVIFRIEILIIWEIIQKDSLDQKETLNAKTRKLQIVYTLILKSHLVEKDLIQQVKEIYVILIKTIMRMKILKQFKRKIMSLMMNRQEMHLKF
jgi:hypothetical protein